MTRALLGAAVALALLQGSCGGDGGGLQDAAEVRGDATETPAAAAATASDPSATAPSPTSTKERSALPDSLLDGKIGTQLELPLNGLAES